MTVIPAPEDPEDAPSATGECASEPPAEWDWSQCQSADPANEVATRMAKSGFYESILRSVQPTSEDAQRREDLKIARQRLSALRTFTPVIYGGA
jgi:hypothetical protein